MTSQSFFTVTVDARKVTLEECPIGLFMYGRTLGVKNEYGEYFIVSSGEVFWGPEPQTREHRSALMVRPCEIGNLHS